MVPPHDGSFFTDWPSRAWAGCLRWKSMFRPKDAQWIADRIGQLRLLAIAGGVVIFVLIADLLGARMAFSPVVLDIPVQRAMCRGTGLRPDVPVHQGDLCLVEIDARMKRRGGVSSSRVWRVSKDRVRRDVLIGDVATLRMYRVPRAWLALGGYAQVEHREFTAVDTA